MPTIADDPTEISYPLPHKAVTLWMVFPVILAAFITILGLGGLVLTRDEDTSLPGGTVSMAALIVIGVAIGVAGVALARASWRNWSYSLSDDWITIRHGVVTKRTVVVPRNRVQTVVTTTGPLDQFLGLTSLTIHTAGIGSPNITIPHLDESAARHVQQELRHDQRTNK